MKNTQEGCQLTVPSAKHVTYLQPVCMLHSALHVRLQLKAIRRNVLGIFTMPNMTLHERVIHS